MSVHKIVLIVVMSCLHNVIGAAAAVQSKIEQKTPWDIEVDAQLSTRLDQPLYALVVEYAASLWPRGAKNKFVGIIEPYAHKVALHPNDGRMLYHVNEGAIVCSYVYNPQTGTSESFVENELAAAADNKFLVLRTNEECPCDKCLDQPMVEKLYYKNGNNGGLEELQSSLADASVEGQIRIIKDVPLLKMVPRKNSLLTAISGTPFIVRRSNKMFEWWNTATGKQHAQIVSEVPSWDGRQLSVYAYALTVNKFRILNGYETGPMRHTDFKVDKNTCKIVAGRSIINELHGVDQIVPVRELGLLAMRGSVDGVRKAVFVSFPENIADAKILNLFDIDPQVGCVIQKGDNVAMVDQPDRVVHSFWLNNSEQGVSLSAPITVLDTLRFSEDDISAFDPQGAHMITSSLACTINQKHIRVGDIERMLQEDGLR